MMSKKKSVTAEIASAGATARKQAPAAKPKTKLARLETLLRRPDGATIEQISKSLDWQAHSVRGAMSGALKKKQGLTIVSEKTDDGRRSLATALPRCVTRPTRTRGYSPPQGSERARRATFQRPSGPSTTPRDRSPSCRLGRRFQTRSSRWSLASCWQGRELPNSAWQRSSNEWTRRPRPSATGSRQSSSSAGGAVIISLQKGVEPL